MGQSYIRRKQFEARLIATEVVQALNKSMGGKKGNRDRWRDEPRGPRQYRGRVTGLLNEMSKAPR